LGSPLTQVDDRPDIVEPLLITGEPEAMKTPKPIPIENVEYVLRTPIEIP
jgi:hypothetical protein